MSNPNGINQFLNEFRETISSATTRLREFTPDQTARETSPGQWSPKEILGHLIDSANNNHQRFVRAQFTDDLVFPGYEQDRWVDVQKYRDAAWPDLIQLWSAYNLHLLHLISVIPEPTLTKARTRHNLDQIAWKTVDANEATTLEYFIRDYVGHLRHHLNQIFETS
jgi:DinB superfamily